MSANIVIQADSLKKVFNRRVVFREVSFALGGQQTLLISGRNGSGKSTLLKIIAGVLAQTSGTIEFAGGKTGPRQDRIGLVSPYLQLYEEFSAEENLRHASAMRGVSFDGQRARMLLERVSLYARKDDPVGMYSSGMKQRAKYAFALLHSPSLLLLDEPMSNLDAEGIGIVRSVMSEQRQAGALIVATNDLSDVERYDERVDLNGPR